MWRESAFDKRGPMGDEERDTRACNANKIFFGSVCERDNVCSLCIGRIYRWLLEDVEVRHAIEYNVMGTKNAHQHYRRNKFMLQCVARDSCAHFRLFPGAFCPRPQHSTLIASASSHYNVKGFRPASETCPHRS